MASSANAAPLKIEASAPNLDWSQAALYSLPHCSTATQLDCVESVAVFDSKSKPRSLTWRADLFQTPYTDALGNVVHTGNNMWADEIDGALILVRTSANAETPSHAYDKDANGNIRRFGAIRTGVDVQNPLTTKVQIVLRTSWIRPLNVPLFAAEATFSQTKISGGNKWVFTGKGVETSGYNDNHYKKLAQNAQADYDAIQFNFTIDHAGQNGESSWFTTECSPIGYTAQASNSSIASVPSWNYQTESLEFGIWAPHTNTKGQLNKGFFQFWVSDAFLDCRFPGNTISKSNLVNVQIVDENGAPQTAVYTQTHQNGRLHISVSGFHYSAPTIKVTAKTSTITCANIKQPKLLKKVTALSPKCPAGFKKKS